MSMPFTWPESIPAISGLGGGDASTSVYHPQPPQADKFLVNSIDVFVFPHTSPWLEQSIKKVRDLGDMPDGWDTYGSRRIQPEAIKGTAQLLKAVEAAHFPRPQISPVPGGALQVEWQVGNRGLEIAVHADGLVDYFGVEGDDYDTAEEGEIRPNDLPALRRLAGWLRGFGSHHEAGSGSEYQWAT